MPIESGGQDRLLSIISTIKMHIDISSESLDMFLGMGHRTSQLCLTWWILEQMLLMEHLKEMSILVLNSSE